MYINFSNLFHDSSKDLTGGGTVRIPKNPAEWPEEWTTVYYKTYPRVKKIALSSEPPSADIFSVIEKRASRREYGHEAISVAQLGTFLKYSCGIVRDVPDQNPARAYPSGGGRYPLEVYPIIFKGSDDVPAGIYHYNVKEHALELLRQKEFAASEIAQLFSYEWAQKASMALVITAVFHRNQMKYGERGYRYILLEAGHLGENVYLVSQALGINCCAIGGMYDQKIEHELSIDGITESVVHAVILG